MSITFFQVGWNIFYGGLRFGYGPVCKTCVSYLFFSNIFETLL